MQSILHIGPPKTATKSLQGDVIPKLGRPYQIKPPWAKALTKSAAEPDLPTLLPGTIVSEEALGAFVALPPATIAARLARIAPGAKVIYVMRDPVELFFSTYRQGLLNLIACDAVLATALNAVAKPLSPDSFFDSELGRYRKRKTGFFASAHVGLVRNTFGAHFDVRAVPFLLLAESADAFVAAFCDACDTRIPDASGMGWLNNSADHPIDAELATLPDGVPTSITGHFREFFAAPSLSEDRLAQLRQWGSDATADR